MAKAGLVEAGFDASGEGRDQPGKRRGWQFLGAQFDQQRFVHAATVDWLSIGKPSA